MIALAHAVTCTRAVTVQLARTSTLRSWFPLSVCSVPPHLPQCWYYKETLCRYYYPSA